MHLNTFHSFKFITYLAIIEAQNISSWPMGQSLQVAILVF